MIKLVASDIDGTLAPEASDKLNPELYREIRELKERGILFVAASGRQYASMLRLFEPVADDVIFIAENGTNVMCRGKNMAGNFLEPNLAEEVIRYLRTLEGCEVLLSAPEMMYVETDRPDYVSLLRDSYHNEVEIVEDVLPYCRRTNKLSLYREAGADEVAEQIQKRFGSRLSIAVAGKLWIDFMAKNTDKGSALATIQNMMHISVEETMAFGDNCNDISLLMRAGESYAVANAHPMLKAAARYETLSSQEDGVVKTIRERLLSSQE